jgi:hypothetical protein
MGQEKSAVRRFVTFTHRAQFFHNANLPLQMNIFLILLGETKEIFVWKRRELFSANACPVKNSGCL